VTPDKTQYSTSNETTVAFFPHLSNSLLIQQPTTQGYTKLKTAYFKKTIKEK